METIRVGVVGVGGMGNGHCASITKDVQEAELVAVCDIDPKVADERAETYGVPAFYDHRKLIRSGLVDAITIATPHYFHPPIAIDAFKAGLHVMSEKPIGVTVKAADKMIAAAGETGMVFGVGYQQRTSGRMRTLKRIVESGRLGRIYRASLVQTHFRTQAYYDSAGWRATWAGEGGGVLLNQAPHGIDIFMWLMGLPKRLTALTRTWRHTIEVEDEASAMIEWENGATGYYHTSTNEVPGADLLEICGDKGKLVFGPGLKLYEINPPIDEFSSDSGIMWGQPECAEVPVEIDQGGGHHSDVIRNWARAILYGEELMAPGAEGILSLEFINAVILSGASGKPVEFPVPRETYERWIRKQARESTFHKVVKEQQVTDPNLGA